MYLMASSNVKCRYCIRPTSFVESLQPDKWLVSFLAELLGFSLGYNDSDIMMMLLDN